MGGSTGARCTSGVGGANPTGGVVRGGGAGCAVTSRTDTCHGDSGAETGGTATGAAGGGAAYAEADEPDADAKAADGGIGSSSDAM